MFNNNFLKSGQVPDYKRDLVIIFVVFLLYYFRHFLSFRLGLNFEEGRDANAYLLAIQGSLPYRDFQWIYGPFAFFVYPLIMNIFGVNLIVLRISYILFASLVIPLAYFLAKRIMPALWAGIASFLSIIFFNVPYYTYNHIFFTLGAMASVLMISNYIQTNKKIHSLVLAGIFCSIALLTKPLITGIAVFAAISLFLLFRGQLTTWIRRVKDILIFTAAAVFLPFVYGLYFYFQTKLKGIAIDHPYFAQDSSLFTDQASRLANIFYLLKGRIISLLPITEIINLNSFAELKKILVLSFDSFINILPFLICGLLLFVFIWSRFKNIRPEIREEILRNKRFLLLLGMFSIFVSFEGLVMTHIYNRAFTIQVTFILTVYLLYLLMSLYQSKRLVASVLITLFLFYLSFLHFFRYPYSNLKRNTEILNLERAKGILVTFQEKKLYESLSLYLSDNLGKKDKIAVIGYYPHLSFLSEQENIFAKDDYVFPNLESLLNRAHKSDNIILVTNLLEGKIISLMKAKKPKVLLIVKAEYLSNFEMMSPKIKNYLITKYYLDRKFNPAPILGRENELARVYSYKLKGW